MQASATLLIAFNCLWSAVLLAGLIGMGRVPGENVRATGPDPRGVSAGRDVTTEGEGVSAPIPPLRLPEI